MSKSSSDTGSVAAREALSVPDAAAPLAFPGIAPAPGKKPTQVEPGPDGVTVMAGERGGQALNSEPGPLEAVVVYRDTVFTSRVLILPEERQLPVSKGLVRVTGSDHVGLKYLDNHPDFIRAKE